MDRECKETGIGSRKIATESSGQALVSVVIPMYNAGQFINETVRSVMGQEYRNWEMLVVDNCSTDASRDIVSDLAKEDPRIKLISSPSNSGSPARPRNMGIQNAKGKYIALLDADDLWLKNKLIRQVDFLEQHNDVFMLYSQYLVMKDGRILDKKIAPPEHKMKSGRIFDSLFLSDNFIPCLTVVFRNRHADNYLFDENPRSMEDFDLWLRISKNEVISFIDKPLAVYRVHDRSTTADIGVFLSKYLTLLKKWQNEVNPHMVGIKYVFLAIRIIILALRKLKNSLANYRYV